AVFADAGEGKDAGLLAGGEAELGLGVGVALHGVGQGNGALADHDGDVRRVDPERHGLGAAGQAFFHHGGFLGLVFGALLEVLQGGGHVYFPLAVVGGHVREERGGDDEKGEGEAGEQVLGGGHDFAGWIYGQ